VVEERIGKGREEEKNAEKNIKNIWRKKQNMCMGQKYY